MGLIIWHIINTILLMSTLLADIITYSPLPIAITIYFAYRHILEPIRVQLNEGLHLNVSTLELVSIIGRNIGTHLTATMWGRLFNISTITPLILSSYNIPYYHNNVKYQYPLIVKKGPKPNYKIYHDHVDISDKILPYFGPNMDLYQLTHLTPKMLGYTSLRLERQNLDCANQSVTFQLNDRILLSKLAEESV
jgi:hypothetical protein